MADVNPPRGISSDEGLKALKNLGADMAAFREDVAAVSGEVAGLKNLIPRIARVGGMTGSAENLAQAQRLTEEERQNLAVATQRLEVLKAQTVELEKQGAALERLASVARAGGIEGGVIVPQRGAALRSEGATGPVGGGVGAAQAFSVEEAARRFQRMEEIAARLGVAPPVGFSAVPGVLGSGRAQAMYLPQLQGLQRVPGFEPQYAPQTGPQGLWLSDARRAYSMPPGQQHALDTALTGTVTELDDAMMLWNRVNAAAAGLVAATEKATGELISTVPVPSSMLPYRPGGGRAQDAAAFSESARVDAASRMRQGGGPPGVLWLPEQPKLVLAGGEDLAAQRATALRLQGERAVLDAKAKEAQENAILVGQETERVAISGALDAAAQRQLALRRQVAGLAPGENAAAMANLAAFPDTAALAASGRRMDFGQDPKLKGYPGLPISYVNQGSGQAAADMPGRIAGAYQPVGRAETEWMSHRAAQTEAADIEGMTSRLNRLGVVQAQASQEMRRHGALTTEFLTALARGETTLQEFGYHITATSAKFAGWTAAAAGVYGVLDAVKHLYTGAKDTQSGLATLSRFFESSDHPFNRAQAAQGFRDVSSDLNVPVADVATAQAAFARVFKDQNDSLTATRVSIQAYKLDQISAADSQRYFTAIVQEFGLSAKDLPVIFDQISAAQRRMGARVAETLPAIARSAAAVKNTGGDINQLIALTATAQVSSGQTGNVVGTAFSRGASNFYRQPANQDVIRSMGINPNQGFTQLLIEAVRKSQDLTGIERTQLARAIGGPQYGARVFQTLLGQDPRLEKALQATSPDAARGSAGKETEKQLQRIDEQISKVGNNLQRLGSAMSETGAFFGLGVALKTLNLMLSTTTHLVEAFDRLPGPLKFVLSNLVLARLALAGMRRTQIGAGVADALGVTVLGPSQGERDRREAIQGARQNEATAMNAREAVTNRMALVQAEANAARMGSVSLRIQAENETNAVRRDALMQQQVAAEARFKVLSAESAELEEQATNQQAIATAARERRVALQKKEIAAGDLTAGEQLLTPGPLRGGKKGPAEPGTLGRTAAAEDLALAASAGEGAAPEVAAAKAEVATTVEEMGGRTAAFRQTASEVKALGGRALGKIRDFATGLDAFTEVFIGFTVVEYLKGQLDKLDQAVAKSNSDLDRIPHSLEELKRRASDAGHAASSGPQHSLTAHLRDFYVQHALGVVMAPLGGPIGYEAGSWLQQHILGTGGESASQAQTDADKARQNADQALINARQHTIHSNVQNVGLANREIIGYAQRDVDNIKNWGQTRGEFNKNFDRYLRDVGVSIEALNEGKVDQNVLDQINQIRAKGDQTFGATKGDPFAAMRHISLKDFANYSGLLGDRADLYGANSADLDAMTRGLEYEIAHHGGTDDPKILQEIAQIQQAIQKYITSMDNDLQQQVRAIADTGASRRFGAGGSASILAGGGMPSISALTGAEDAQQSSTIGAYDSAIARLKKAKSHIDIGFDKATADYGQAQKHLDELKRVQAGQRADEGGRFHDSIPQDTPGDISHQVEQAQAAADAAKKKMDRLRAAQKKDADAIQQAIDKDQQAKLDYKNARVDVDVAYNQSIASDQMGSINAEIAGDRQKLLNALDYVGPEKPAKVLAAMTKLNQDFAQKAQQKLTDVQTAGDLATSRIMTLGPAGDRARLESQLATARQKLAAARAETNYPGKKSDIQAAETAVNNLTFQILQGAQQDAQNAHDLARQLYDSRMAIRMAGVSDPLKLDRMQLEQDQHDLTLIKRGDFKTAIEYQIARNNQTAKNRQDQVKLRQDSIQSDYDTAQFEHQMGQLSDDAYIAQLRQIIHMKGITKQMKRQLLLEIHNVTSQSAGGLDLNVGNIRLPSIYEVRRAMRGAAGTQTVVHNNVTNHFAVSRDVDLGKLGAAVESTFGGPVMANLRAAGVA